MGGSTDDATVAQVEAGPVQGALDGAVDHFAAAQQATRVTAEVVQRMYLLVVAVQQDLPALDLDPGERVVRQVCLGDGPARDVPR